MVNEVNAINIRRMRERFDALSSRIAADYAEEGLAEIDAAIASERAAHERAG